MREFTSMPERQPDDGKIGLECRPDGKFVIGCGKDALVISEFNLVRLFAVTALMLGIPMSKKAQRIIKL